MSSRCPTPRLEQSHHLVLAKRSQSISSKSERASSNNIAFVRPSTASNPTAPLISMPDRRAHTLLELKQQRLIAAADRKKRLITRIVTIVGLLIIVLCAAIVTLTLKMAPKIDELVRSKSGQYNYIPVFSRISTIQTTIVLNSTDSSQF